MRIKCVIHIKGLDSEDLVRTDYERRAKGLCIPAT